MPEDRDLLGQMTSIGQTGIDAFGRLDEATRKFQRSGRRGSIVKSAQANIFEFPVFISNSVALDYVTATTSLLEQVYASYVQFSISINPVVDAKTVKNGLQFANFKTDTNKYLEYTDMSYAHDACHAVYTEGDYVFEFDMVSIEDSDARLINEAMDYQPLSEFDHFFQEQLRKEYDDDEPYLDSILLNNRVPVPKIENGKIVTIKGENNEPDIIVFQINELDGEYVKKPFHSVKKYMRENVHNENEYASMLNKYLRYLNENAHIIGPSYLEVNGRIDSVMADNINRLQSLNKNNRDSMEVQQSIDELEQAIPGIRSVIYSSWEMSDLNFNRQNLALYESQIETLKFKLAHGISLDEVEKAIWDSMSKKGKQDIRSQINDTKNAAAMSRKTEMLKMTEAQYRILDAKIKVGTPWSELSKDEQGVIDKTTYDRLLKSLETKRQYDEENLINLRNRNSLHDIEKANNEYQRDINAYKLITEKIGKHANLTDAEIKMLGGQENVDRLEALQNFQDDITKYRAQTLERDAQKATSRYYKSMEAIGVALKNVDSGLRAMDAGMSLAKNAATFKTDIKYKKESLKQTILKNEEMKLKNQELKKRLETMDEDRAFEQKVKKQNMLTQLGNSIHAPSFIDESKINKLNTMKPLMMNVSIQMLNKDDTIQPINYVVGVKVRNHLIPADVLPEVAMYPLKEMDKISRKVKWRAGELKFFKDLVFRIDQKKQTAVDSRDPRRKWYRRLYELAHMKGDAPTTAVIRGKSLFTTFLREKIGKRDIANGLIPNATIIISQNDVTNIKSQTSIDLLNASTARKFCGELFLISFVVIDMEAESVKIMFPDSHNDFEVHSLASINKQLATLDTSGSKTRDMFKLLGR